jgi:hypothetical protein
MGVNRDIPQRLIPGAARASRLDRACRFVYSYLTVGGVPRLEVGLIGLGNMGAAFAARLYPGSTMVDLAVGGGWLCM